MTYSNKIYISLGSIFIFSVVLIFLLVAPAVRGISEQSSQLIGQKKELALIELTAKDFEAMKKNYQSYESGLKEMEDLLNQESFIDPEIPVNFINFFKDQAQSLNLSLRVSQIVVPSENIQSWNNIAFRIDGAGNFVDVMKFLEKLEHSRWLIEVTSLNIIKQEMPRTSVNQGTADNGYVEINLLIKAYAQKKN